MKTTLKQVKAGAALPAPIYKSKPYIVLSKNDVVLAAGDLDYLQKLDGYFDEFPVEVRRHDLDANDNAKIQPPKPMPNKTKHTPGPWKHNKVYDSIVSMNPDYRFSMIAKIATGEDDNQENANAQLIAAAPDLLAAVAELEQAARIVISVLNAKGGNSAKARQLATAHVNEAIRKVQQAIAKATGN